MSLKRRNAIALALLLLGAILWTLGQQLVEESPESHSVTMATLYPAAAPLETGAGIPAPSTPAPFRQPGGPGGNRALGILLSCAALLAAGAAVFLVSQKAPLLGPDGVFLLLAVLAAGKAFSQQLEYILWSSSVLALTLASGAVSSFCGMLGLRELWGWARARFSLGWCLVSRGVRRCRRPQSALLILGGWIFLSLGGALCFLTAVFRYGDLFSPFACWLAAAVLGICCLWQYGADLGHFQRQLNNYREGLPIEVRDGAFSGTEAQLLEVRAAHEEAVRAAVTSERFKVELIANVSHDLRTPLTSILGYSELLQQETLSPEGKEQLQALYRKAGYMNELVESLFELTKVSSGVQESKQEKIDLIRLLEQTLGLFEDQLLDARLSVRRSYEAQTVPVITDGARMHQVFANLLGNAIKYALAGTRIYLEVRETAGGHRVRVMNTASYEMDFDPQEILQRFARGDKARSTKGSGLGLAIAQTYTESVGGSFRVAIDGDQFSAIVELPKTERNL